MFALGTIATLLYACATPPPTKVDIASYRLPQIIAGGQVLTDKEFVSELQDARVVAVAEHHDRFDHHLNQLEVIRLLHRSYPDIAIGMEYFQQPFQEQLDAFVAGEISINEMLRRTEYYDRWKYDFRMLEPILRYARDNTIPLIALNIPAEITRKVARGGIEGLTMEDRKWVPGGIDRTNQRYRARLEKIFEDHPITAHGGSVERLIEGQLLWDEGMAQRAAEYLQQHRRRKMVLLAGRGHIEFGFGIPDRIERRLAQGEVAIVIQDDGETVADDSGDYVLRSRELGLPKPGLLGVFIERDAERAVVSSLSDKGAASAAGVRAGDVIVSVNDEPVTRFADLKASLWDKSPGDTVSVTIERQPDLTRRFDVVLR